MTNADLIAEARAHYDGESDGLPADVRLLLARLVYALEVAVDNLRVERLAAHTCSSVDGELAAALAENKRLRAEVKSLLRECRADNEPLTQGERDVFAYIAEQLDDLLDGGSDDRE